MLNAQAGDSRAMRGLLSRYQEPLKRYIMRLLGNEADVQDVLQDSLMACCRQINSLQDPARFRAWLYRIATNRCHDWQRQHYRDRAQLTEWYDQADSSAEQRVLQQDVMEVLMRLSPDDRHLLSLFYLEGFSIRELALTMDLSLSAVKTRLYRARSCFQQVWDRN